MSDLATILATLRDRYVYDGQRAATYLAKHVWEANRALEDGQSPQRAKFVTAAIDLTRCIEVLAVLGEISEGVSSA